MGAEEFPGGLVEHRLDHALGIAQGDGLAVANKGETSHAHLMACYLGRHLRQAD